MPPNCHSLGSEQSMQESEQGQIKENSQVNTCYDPVYYNHFRFVSHLFQNTGTVASNIVLRINKARAPSSSKIQ